MAKQRIVIVGSNGFVGSAILQALDTDRYEPIAVSRRECDFSDPSSIISLSKLLQDGDIVVCAAAKAPAKNLDMLAENVTIISHIAQALNDKKLSYVLNIGSDAVYADSMEKITETSTVAPLSAHGIMHCMREYILERTIDAPIGTLRPTLIYGEADPHNGYGPNSFIRLAKEGKDIALFGNGEEQRDHIYVGDVAALAVAMIEQKTTGAVNAVTGKVISFMEIAELASEAGNVRITTKPRSGPMPHNGYRGFDNAAARRVCPTLEFQDIGEYIRAAVSQEYAV